ncbi:MAG: hypothetical protein EOM68_31140 [Spirochaetia bacterium]|nr:hypothetical protein [Spirochaetia bacterium]
MYRKIISENKVAGLAELLKECRSYQPDEQEWLIGLFLDGLDSRSEAGIDKESSVDSDDLATVGGRCAFFCRELLNVSFPPIRSDATVEHIQQAKTTIYNRIVDIRKEKLEADIAAAKQRLLEKPLEERLSLARSEKTEEIVFMALAKDEAVTVRLAVAQNMKAPIRALAELGRDQDEGVRKAAMKNLEVTRPIPLLFPH